MDEFIAVHRKRKAESKSKRPNSTTLSERLLAVAAASFSEMDSADFGDLFPESQAHVQPKEELNGETHQFAEDDDHLRSPNGSGEITEAGFNEGEKNVMSEELGMAGRMEPVRELGDEEFQKKRRRKESKSSDLKNDESTEFNILSALFNSQPDFPQQSSRDTLKTAFKEGDVHGIGVALMNGFESGSFSDKSVKDLMSTMYRPEISLEKLYVNTVNMEREQRAVVLGTNLLLNNQSSLAERLNRLEADMNSIKASINKRSQLALQEKVPLLVTHRIEPIQCFVRSDIGALYDAVVPMGENNGLRMKNTFECIIPKIIEPQFKCWLLSHRETGKNADRHSRNVPDKVLIALKDFGLDALGLYLPDSLLTGPIPDEHEFYRVLGTTQPVAEVERRRTSRFEAMTAISSGLTKALKSLRDYYHFDVDEKHLVRCEPCCGKSAHVRWDELKWFNENLRLLGKTKEQIDEYAIEHVVNSRGIISGPTLQAD